MHSLSTALEAVLIRLYRLYISRLSDIIRVEYTNTNNARIRPLGETTRVTYTNTSNTHEDSIHHASPLLQFTTLIPPPRTGDILLPFTFAVPMIRPRLLNHTLEIRQSMSMSNDLHASRWSSVAQVVVTVPSPLVVCNPRADFALAAFPRAAEVDLSLVPNLDWRFTE